MKDIYHNRIRQYQDEADRFRKKADWIAVARMFLFLAMINLAWYFIS